MDVIEVRDEALREDLARSAESVAAIFSKADLIRAGAGYDLVHKPLYKRQGLSEAVRFAHQASAAGATAFVVGPVHVMTAAHCIDRNMLDETRFVFGYRVEEGGSTRLHVPDAWVFRAKALIEWQYEPTTGRDWAIVEVDRPIGRAPLRLRYDQPVRMEETVYYLGHPRGLPMKYGGIAQVIDLGTDVFFRANIDSFKGASGAPVFDADHRVVGIHVRGIVESVLDKTSMSVFDRVVQTGSPEAIGEDVVRVSQVPKPKLQSIGALL